MSVGVMGEIENLRRASLARDRVAGHVQMLRSAAGQQHSMHQIPHSHHRLSAGRPAVQARRAGYFLRLSGRLLPCNEVWMNLNIPHWRSRYRFAPVAPTSR